MANFNFSIPDELHKKFKIHSIQIEKDMKDILIEVIEDIVKKGNKK